MTMKGTGTLVGEGYEQGQTIDSPLEEVFARLSDFGNPPQCLIPS
jgi:hypothetical protein